MEFLVEQCTVRYDEMIQTGYRSSCRCRSLHILAGRRGNAICYRSMCVTAIRCCTGLSAKRNVCRYRIKSCLIILRRLALERAGLTDRMSDLYRRHRVAGFNTYGEQHSGMHVNQTFVGLAFMRSDDVA